MSMGLFVMLTTVALQVGLGVSNLVSDSHNQNSLCHQYHRTNATHLVSYMETYQPNPWSTRTLTKIDFRIETVTKWNVVETCCNGYEPHQLSEDAENCVPICPSGCSNGECNLPNVCICNPGYNSMTNNLTKFSECIPECESGCQGGICVEPNVCHCSDGYISVNNNTSCEPLCLSIDGSQAGCIDNASCVSPYTCQCNNGYAPVWDIHLDITDENQTTKASTATNISSITLHRNPVSCSPVCDTVCDKNAVCIGPNICQCISGYETNQSDNGSLCLPVCEKKCFNGYCGSPNECVCFEGYKPHRWLNTSLCEPFCQDNCVNGKCTLPNNCECLDGYEKLIVRNGSYDKISANICIPICPGVCANGSCIAPGQCHCNPGYILVSAKQDAFTDTASTPNGEHSINLFLQSCEPFCEPACPNGSICIAPNQCQSQIPHDQDISRLPKNRTKIVNSTMDCDTRGLLFEDNGNCYCNYDSNGQKCNEPSICAVLMTNDTKTDGKFTTLESIVFLNGTTKTANGKDDERKERLNECRNECRILISTKQDVKSINGSGDNCYQLELYNGTVGLLSTKLKNLKLIYLEENSSVLCFVSPGFGCNAKELRVISSKSGGVIGIIIGAILTVVLIAGFGLAVYLTRRRKCNIRLFRAGTSGTDGTIMEQSEATDSPFNTDESSRL